MAKQPAKEQIVIDDGIQLFKYPWTFQDLLAKNCMECYSNSRNNQGKIWSGRGLKLWYAWGRVSRAHGFLMGNCKKFIGREIEEYKLGVCRAFVHFWIS